MKINNTNTYRTNALLTGIFFLITDITAIAGLLLYQPLLTNPNFIVSGNVNTVPILLGVFLEIILAIAAVGTALTLYPVLKKQNQSLALGYLVFRVMEALIIIVGILCILTVLTLRQNLSAASGDPSTYQAISSAFVALKNWTFTFGPNILLPVNATILGYLLYKSKIVPKTIALIALIDGPILFIVCLGVVFGLYEQSAPFPVLIAMPMLVFEVWFAIRLITKGFNSSAINKL